MPEENSHKNRNDDIPELNIWARAKKDCFEQMRREYDRSVLNLALAPASEGIDMDAPGSYEKWMRRIKQSPPADYGPAKNAAARLLLIAKLERIHPAILQGIDRKIAHYIGGMADSGGLNYSYCLFEAPLESLKYALDKASEK